MFESHVSGWSDNKVDMLVHDNKRVDLEAAFASVAIHGSQEQAHVILDHKQPASLPRRKGAEISSGRRDESSRFQMPTSAAKAAGCF